MAACRKPCFSTTKNLIDEYSQRSTIHGVSYITEPGRSWIEKVWWIGVLSFSVLVCGKLIFDATNISPIIISFTEKPTAIWQIPFPAVTICPASVASWSLTDVQIKGDEYFYGLSDKKKMQTLAKNAFCPNGWLNIFKNYSNCNGCLETIRQIKIPPEEIFVECKFKNEIINCTGVLEEVVLFKNLCYNFNGFKLYRQTDEDAVTITHSEWSIDDGYRPVATAAAYPRRVFSPGVKYGLSILLRRANEHRDSYCASSNGFMVEYRMPYESPQFRTNFFMLRMEKTLNLIAKPQMIVTADEVRDYSVQERKCYFSNEKRLKYFRQYTQSNCEIECETEDILKTCNCLPIFIENRKGVDVCGPQQHQCSVSAFGNLVVQHHRPCHCLPLCSSISFDSEVQTEKYNSPEHANDDQ